MEIKLWIDDIRPAPDGYNLTATNAYCAIGAVLSGEVAHISFDHDLGRFCNEEGSEIHNTGYAVAKMIEEWAIKYFLGIEKLAPRRITWEIHSANPEGRRRIELAMRNAERHWDLVELE